MAADLEEIYDRLYKYCDGQGFAGHDPFDGLNSALFQLVPLKYVRTARLAWLQMIKRSPIDLRGVLRIPKGDNPKGLALFALAELGLSRATGANVHTENARSLVKHLLTTRITGETANGQPTTAFGYNFDWQSRHFFAPQGTPAIVPTAFAARALMEGHQAFGDERYLTIAIEVCNFILHGLNRVVETEDEVCFSYTPLDRSIVYNANLLAGETLAVVGSITNNDLFLKFAAKAARFVLRRQRPDGAWAYGDAANQHWVDNFHTAYVLYSLKVIATNVQQTGGEIAPSFDLGKKYWLDNFFLADGAPKYYDSAVYPIDVHSCAVAIVALCAFDERDLARKTAQWTVEHMFDPKGYFYYQIRKNGAIKTPYMRWGQAWMAYALARLIEVESKS